MSNRQTITVIILKQSPIQRGVNCQKKLTHLCCNYTQSKAVLNFLEGNNNYLRLHSKRSIWTLWIQLDFSRLQILKKSENLIKADDLKTLNISFLRHVTKKLCDTRAYVAFAIKIIQWSPIKSKHVSKGYTKLHEKYKIRTEQLHITNSKLRTIQMIINCIKLNFNTIITKKKWISLTN